MADAVVIGAGPNGLVAANLLVDQGWSVRVLEATDEPGGAVRSGQLTVPGFTHDLFSAFYPLAAASPVIQSLELERYGLRWRRAPVVLAHVARDAGYRLWVDPAATAAELDERASRDGAAWLRLHALWDRIGEDITGALFTPFPPVRNVVRLLGRLKVKGTLDLARFATLPVRRLGDEEFRGEGPGLLLAGSALHSDLAPESVLSGFFGWLLCSLGHDVGWPVPQGGAGMLGNALVERLRDRGGTITCRERVTKIEVEDGRAIGVTTASGNNVRARRAILADVGAPQLYASLVPREELPSEIFDGLQRFQYDNATIKIDWALDRRIPWATDEPVGAGTVHLARDMDDLTRYSAQLNMGLIPDDPFIVLGQMTTTDPSRSPEGTETAWAYTHVPQRAKGDAAGRLTGTWSEGEVQDMVNRMESRIEEAAPGFGSTVLGRHVMGPREMEDRNPNLVGGAVNGGTAQLHQQAVFRPMTGFGRSETPIEALFLASASAHPGGGVHGAPGSNAARAALNSWRARSRILPLGLIGAAGVAGIAARQRTRR